jgi:hypothetical protein
MKLRNILSICLGIIAMGSAILASAIPDSVNSFKYEIPFYVVAIIAGVVALALHYWLVLRRITYPAVICMQAWLYEHHLSKSKFSCHTYRVYVVLGGSYKTLYNKVQGAFDQYLEASSDS